MVVNKGWEVGIMEECCSKGTNFNLWMNNFWKSNVLHGDYNIVHSKFAKRTDLKCFITETKTTNSSYVEVVDSLTSLIVVIILQCTHITN
jgi:hypothetical protein